MEVLGGLTPSHFDSFIHSLFTKSGPRLGARDIVKRNRHSHCSQGTALSGEDRCQSNSHILLNKIALSQSKAS